MAGSDTLTRPVALVTGGGRGIGAAVAVRLARDGWDVAVAYERDAEAAERTCEATREAGARALAQRCDVADAGAVAALFAAVDAGLGAVSGLVNCAGVAYLAPTIEADPDRLARLFAVNALGTILCCKEALRRMAMSRGGGGGVIVNVSSIAAATGGRAGLTSYAASKAAVETFTLGLAKEVAGEGVRVAAVRPGLVDTEMASFVRASPQAYAAAMASVPMGRMGEPEEIAAAVAFLLSDEASYVTGATLEVAGGGLAQGPGSRPGG